MSNLNAPQVLKKPVDEISVRTLMLKLIAYGALVLKRWYLIILGGLLLGGYFYHQSSQIIDTYPARVKIFVSPQNVDKKNAELIEVFSKLMNSQQLLIKVFLKTVFIQEEPKLLINEYLSTYYSLNPEGLPPSIPLDFKIEQDELAAMSNQERQVLNEIIAKVSTPLSDFSDGFISITGDFKLGFITINLSSPSEQLSLLLLDQLYQEIEQLILKNSVYASKLTYEKLTRETDSLARAYKNNYYELNIKRDNRERILAIDPLKDPKRKSHQADIKYLAKKIHRLSVDAEISKTGYLAALEQQKLAQSELDQKSIIIQEIERSFAPIQPFHPNIKMAAIKGGILGSIGVVVIILMIAVFKEIRSELYPSN